MNYLPNRRILVASVAFAVFALGLLAACASDQAAAPTAIATPAPPTPTALPRGGTLTVRASADAPELRPWQPRSRAEEQAITLLYSGLTHLDNKLQPRPDLAERWDTSADGRLITFTLRSNLNWHDGAPLTADDVAYTIGALREISPTTALLADLRDRIATVSTVATNTVEISLTERYAPILADLAVPILPKHLLNGKNLAAINFWDVPIGSGPFKFVKREPGKAITFAVHPLFYRGPPLLDQVVLVVTPDLSATTKALANGQLLLAELPPNVAFSNVQAGEYVENGSYFLAFNTRAGRVFAEPQVRNALAAAIDLPKLVRAATNGIGKPIADGAAPSSWADFLPPPTSTLDLRRAKALLDEAGWRQPDGSSVRERNGQQLAAQIFVRGDDPRRIKAAKLIVAAAASVGISLTVQPADFDSVIRSKYLPPYDFDLLIGSWSGGVGDPQFGDYLFYDPDDYPLFHSSQINQGAADTRPVLNFTGFSDPVYEAQAIAARQLYAISERSQSLRRTQQRLSDLKPYFYLWSDKTTVTLSPHVTTLDGQIDINSPAYLWNIERWYLTKR